MLLTEIAVYILIGIAAAVELGTVTLFKRSFARGKLHGIVVGVSVVVAGGVAIALIAASHVIRISARTEVSEERVLGAASVQLGASEVEITGNGSGVTVIVNESDRTLEVQTLVYGERPAKVLVPPDVSVGPHSTYTLLERLERTGGRPLLQPVLPARRGCRGRSGRLRIRSNSSTRIHVS